MKAPGFGYLKPRPFKFRPMMLVLRLSRRRNPLLTLFRFRTDL